MKNPFDPLKQNNEFKFFNEMTEAINEWMLNKYPEFDNSLISKIRKVELSQQHLETSIRTHDEFLKKERLDYIQNAIKQINDFLSKEYPDIDGKLKDVSTKLDKQAKNMEEKLKEFKVYKSLCDDVYKMRDEFTEVQKFIESFKKKMKKAFEI